MGRSNIPVILFMIFGLGILMALGTWQVSRLFWKEALIERVEARLDQEPFLLNSDTVDSLTKEDHEYAPVRVKGSFDHGDEVYFFSTGKGGGSGWHVHTPVDLDDGTRLIVNRGFVPFELKDPATRAAGQLAGNLELAGLLRFPLPEKPFGSLGNEPEKREYYWRNVGEMSAIMSRADYLPVIVDLDDTPVPGGWPRGGTTILNFPNNHLQYAITWYGLALTLLGVGGYFLYSRRQDSNE